MAAAVTLVVVLPLMAFKLNHRQSASWCFQMLDEERRYIVQSEAFENCFSSKFIRKWIFSFIEHQRVVIELFLLNTLKFRGTPNTEYIRV